MSEGDIPRVTVAVLNHNGREWLHACLESLTHTDYPNLDIVVVDNGSTDGSEELVRTNFPRMRILALGSNLGFTGAYNRVFDLCDAEYVLLLNNDTVVPDPGWIRSLASVMESDPKIAAATCKILYLHQPERINSLGGSAYWWTGSFDLGDGEIDGGQYDSPAVEPFAFCGAAALLRLSAVREVGGFDDSLFAYREDFDLSWRLRLRGYQIQYVPQARVLHAGGATWGPLSHAKLYLSTRNWLRIMLKNYSVRSLARALPAYLAFEFLVRSPGLAWVSGSVGFGLIPYRSVFWNFVNLRNTLRARHCSQSGRKVSDQPILPAMGPAGFEPLNHLWRRARTLQETHDTRSCCDTGRDSLPPL